MLKSIDEVKGYYDLSKHDRRVFAEFLNNFYNEWPEKHIPIAVRVSWDEGIGQYLRVEFEEMWLHVKSPTEWF